VAADRIGWFFQRFAARERAFVMGVLNATPDSFSDGGRHLAPEAAVAAARAMAAEGADLVDLGGESTRPGAGPVDEAEELARVGPVLDALRDDADVVLSIDTRRAAIAERALDAGAVLVNDVTAGADPAMLPLVAARGAGIALMHMRGEPATMQRAPRYADVVEEVESFLLARATAAAEAGIPRGRVLLDPGIGFGKTRAHNLELLRGLPRLAGHGFPVLLGVSRKSLLGALTDRPVDGRLHATTAAHALGAAAGAAMVRAHDVGAALDAVKVAAAWRAPGC